MSFRSKLKVMSGMMLLGCACYGAAQDSIAVFDDLFRKPDLYLIPAIEDIYGVVFDDVNHDDKPDLYLVCFRGLNRFLINQGMGQPFRDVTIQSGLGGDLMPRDTINLELGAALADVNNDGWRDLWLAGWGNTTQLFLNDKRLRFVPAPQLFSYPEYMDANACTPADVNGDGWIDLFITDEHQPNRLFINKGGRYFREEAKERGVAENGVSQGAAFCDVDLDGDPDLYVANWRGEDWFYQNDGNGHFIRIYPDLPSLMLKTNTNAAIFGDIDNDGDSDLLVTHREGRNFLYLNQQSPGDKIWRFKEAADSLGLRETDMSYGGVIADFNNDGWQDIFITNIGENRLYLNRGHGAFRLIFSSEAAKSGMSQGYSTGAACADIDQDGDLDLFIANKDTFGVMYINRNVSRLSIRVRLHGVRSNRDAFGARVRMYRAGYLDKKDRLLGYREVSGSHGYLSASETIVHFGMDTVRAADLRIDFSSGRSIVRAGIRSGRILDIYEYPKLYRAGFQAGRAVFRQITRWQFWSELGLVIFYIALLWIFGHIGLYRHRWPALWMMFTIAGFFALGWIFLILLTAWPLLVQLIFVNGLTLLLVLLLSLYGEFNHRLRESRDRYRTLLIDLSEQMLQIHEDQVLVETVVNNLSRHTEFDRCGVYMYLQDSNRWIDGYAVHLPDAADLNAVLGDTFRSDLMEKKALVKSRLKYEEPFVSLQSQCILAIGRQGTLRGLLSLGASSHVAPFTSDDLRLFETLANQMAVALENNAYIRESNRMIRELTESRVRQSYIEELEESNRRLDQKNQELQTLYDELSRTESKLIQSEKMASLGQLVAGISHELNNPISFIYANIKQLKTYIDQLKQNLHPEDTGKDQLLEDLDQLVRDTVKGSQSVKEIVRHLRRFSHIDQAERKMANVHEGIETCLMILRPKIGKRIQIHKTFEADGMVECNIGQLNQVFLNVLANAVQSISDQGDVWVSTSESTDHLTIRIRDNGGGVSKENLGRIFDPFFTTKEVGQGTGLGLSVSYAVVQQHQGKIEVESTEGEGTVFMIELPKKENEVKQE